MISPRKAAVWLDHHEARVVRVDAASFDETSISAPHRHVHRHPLGAAEPHHHPDDLQRFLREIADALRDADQLLILGPSTAKLQLLRYLRDHEPAIERRVLAVETVDHPSARELAAHVRRYFKVGAAGAATDARSSVNP